MARPSLVLLVLVKCCAVWAEYGDYGDYGDDEGYFLEGSTKGGSGYNYDDGFDKKAKDGYGYESHSEYGHGDGGDGGDGENGSYESSYTYGHDEKPKYSAYSYSSSSGSPYDGPSYETDYDGDHDATKVKPKKAKAEALDGRTYQNLYDDPNAYPGFDVPGAYSNANGVYSNSADASSVYNDAQEALRSVELLSKLAGPKYKQLFLPSRR